MTSIWISEGGPGLTIVLLSLKPEFAAKILAREKRFEFRRTRFKRHTVTAALMYANSTERRIVGAFEIDSIHQAAPAQLWAKYHTSAGISEQAFFEYFDGADRGYAIQIARIHRFSPAVNPYKALRGFVPPQSFCYLSAQKTRRLLPPGLSVAAIDHHSTPGLVTDQIGAPEAQQCRFVPGSAVRVSALFR